LSVAEQSCLAQFNLDLQQGGLNRHRQAQTATTQGHIATDKSELQQNEFIRCNSASPVATRPCLVAAQILSAAAQG
jgi:hypothetical protein